MDSLLFSFSCCFSSKISPYFRRIYIHKWRRTQKEKKKKKQLQTNFLFCLQCLFVFLSFSPFLPMHIAVSLVSALCFIACNQDWIGRPVVKTLFGFFFRLPAVACCFFYSGPLKTNFFAFPLAGNGVVDSWNVERVSSEKTKQNALLYSCTSSIGRFDTNWTLMVACHWQMNSPVLDLVPQPRIFLFLLALIRRARWVFVDLRRRSMQSCSDNFVLSLSNTITTSFCLSYPCQCKHLN